MAVKDRYTPSEQKVLDAIAASRGEVDAYAASLKGRGFEEYLGTPSLWKEPKAGNGAMKWLLPSLLIAAAVAYSLR